MHHFETKIGANKFAMIPNITGNEELAIIWKAYFNSAWFLGLSPFKVIQNDKLSLFFFKRKQSLAQNIVCALISFVVLLFCYHFIIHGIIREKLFSELITQDKSGFLFQVAVALVQVTATTLSIHELWFHQRDIIGIINFLHDPTTCIPRATNNVILKVKILMIAGFFILSIAEVITELYFVYESVDQNWNSLCLMANKYLSLAKEDCLEPGTANVVTFQGKLVATLAIFIKCIW